MKPPESAGEYGNAEVRVELLDLGMVDYGECLALQRRLFDEVAAGGGGRLILCEHPHVYTLGKSGRAENLLVGEDILRERGAALYRVERGGDITYHGPGQIVGYPILDLGKAGLGLREYIAALERSVMETAGEFGIETVRSEGKTGVWIRDGESERKICAIGVRSSRWITMHGFALNVATDPGWFDLINPCGFAGGAVTSIEAETGGRVDMKDVKKVLCGRLEANLKMKIM